MSEHSSLDKTCVIIGASHAGVNFAFALRKEGWEGKIILYDKDPELPYHRPPLSKTYITTEDGIDKNLLKAPETYDREHIVLNLGKTIRSIHPEEKKIVLADESTQPYDILVLATGARPIIPNILGLDGAKNVYTIRTAADANHIRETLVESARKRVVVIGGGYIGLEIAASLKKLGAEVTVLEREERILGRVTVPQMATFFQEIHLENGVSVLTQKNVVSVEEHGASRKVICSDGSYYTADIIIIGVGIHVNKELAENAGLHIKNGILVDETTKTSIEDIYAIGDCTFHYNPYYDRFVRLESVQNAVDQAKVAAAAICGKSSVYDTIPWFWSDQYDVKLQMVGLSEGYNEIVIRKEQKGTTCFSIWYFKDDRLLAVDAINNAKAYVIGTKCIKNGQSLDKSKLSDGAIVLKVENITAA